MTGAAGFLGRHLMDRLADSGIEPIGLDHWEGNLADTDHRLMRCDLCLPLPDVEADVIYSLAATADPAEALQNPAGCYRNGVLTVANTIEHARRTGARVIHVSSNEAADARGPYAAAKACQELVCRAQDEVPVVIATVQSLFGEWQPTAKLVPTIIRHLAAGDPVPLQHHDGTFAIRPWVHAGIVAAALAHLGADDSYHGDVPLGSDQPVSNLHVVEVIAEHLDVEPIILPVAAGDRPGHEFAPEPVGGIHTHLAHVDEALRNTVDWYLARG